jgi:hypothetical protein
LDLEIALTARRIGDSSLDGLVGGEFPNAAIFWRLLPDPFYK